MRKLNIALPLILAACAGSVETRATNSLAIVCDTYATTLSELTKIKDKLSAGQIDKVNTANRVVDPVCSPGSKVDPSKAISQVKSAVQVLTAIKESF